MGDHGRRAGGTGHGSTTRARRLEVGVRAGAPALGQPHEGLLVALGARQARGREAEHRGAVRAGAAADGDERRAAIVGRAHDAALAHPLAPDLELRLDHGQRVEALRAAGEHGGQHLGQGDEGEVGDHEVGGVGQVAGDEVAGVRALDHRDAIVGAQRPVELTIGDVEGDHVGRAALQQAVGEAARRGPDVQAPAPGDVDARRLQRVGELDPPARDEARALVDGQLDVLGHELAGLGGAIAVAAAQPDLAGHDRRRGAGARGEEPALGEQGVEADLGHRDGPGTLPPARKGAVP